MPSSPAPRLQSLTQVQGLQLKVVSGSESMNPRNSHQVDRTFSSHLFGIMWFQESEFPFTSTPNCGHLPKKGPLSFGNSNGLPPRSVFPELAKYTLLAFAAMLGVNVLYADLDWAERHKVGRHMRLYIWHRPFMILQATVA